MAGVYKIAQFYFTILNLIRQHKSSLNNIFCIASAFNQDVKKYGFNTIIQPILKDLKELEITGLQIALTNSNETFFASIAQVSGDNLGIHQIFGIKCCLRGENICHLCNASTNMIQKCFHESDFVKITKISYEKKLKEVLEDQSNIALYGLRESTDLNSLNYFHITNNYMFDLFHDIWEGVAKYEVRFLLERYIKFDKFFDLIFLNNRIFSFNYGPIDFFCNYLLKYI